MLAAMSATPRTSPEPGEPLIRDRGDACPGALRLHAADDGRLARLRLPGGLLTESQVLALADAAESLGDGGVSVTSRGNAELRGLGEGCGGELAALLDRAGLLPSPTHERVRNIVASPTAGLDGLGGADVQLWARELDALLCAEAWTAALSGRFLFVLDDGRGDVAGLGGDVTLLAGTGGDRALLLLGDQALRVAAGDAPRAALAAADAFLRAAADAGTGAWRVRELPEGCVPDLAGALARAGLDAELVPGPVPPLPAGRPPVPGPLGPDALYVLAPLGRLTAAQLRALLPAREVRLTPWRGAVVVAPRDGLAAPAEHADPAERAEQAQPPARLAELAAHGLITHPHAPGTGVGACTGRPGCAKALADVRRDAAHAPHGLLPVHFSGCARRCGHPHGAWVDVLATEDGAYLVDGAPTPRTSLSEAVAAARGPATPTR
ncbi:cobalamin biosynthesis protein CobG [Streptomyces sp. NPDC094032]|uniref:cobalamin biosynthesis protein CobG n=1 Tax=Streptomyces sp. NPDC094032 TaxID=3155308 RepID=UPI00332E55CE